jgi:hypothetical protein
MRHGNQILATLALVRRQESVNMRQNVWIINQNVKYVQMDIERHQLNKENVAIIVKKWFVKLMVKYTR